MHIADEAELERIYEADTEPDEGKECPFCHNNPLNQFGACTECHTILPHHVRRPQELWSKLEDLSVEFQYEKKADVKKAISQLTPLQQKIVTHVITGNETLAEFAQDSGYSHQTIWREWRKAKLTLTSLLADYADRRVSNHGQTDLQACLN